MADDVVRKGDRIEIADGLIRIEAGPALRRRRATPEALANDVTADHYQVGRPDAAGDPIVEGEMFSYLDYHQPPVFYVFKRRDILPGDKQFEPQPPDPGSPPLPKDSTNVRSYSYTFDQVGDFGTEDEAIEFGKSLAAGD